jgi:hypothetical protein
MVIILISPSEISSEISENPKHDDFNTKVLKSRDFTEIKISVKLTKPVGLDNIRDIIIT